MAAAIAATTYQTEFGSGWVAFTGSELVQLGLPGSAVPFPIAQTVPQPVALLADGLSDYWRGGDLPAVSDELLLKKSPTALTADIYRAVAAIPAGTTATYATVASRVGRPAAARAVGAAMAANQLAPLIPCHRVVGSDGSLRGYAGGLDMKRFLLDLELGAQRG